MNKDKEVPVPSVLPIIESKIYYIRGQKVMLDKDLAEIYGVQTKSLNLAVRRNILRFPQDFMFKLSSEEYENLRFQFATSSLEHGGTRYLPYAFTEHGVAMLSSVLRSERAVQMNIFIIRAFIKIRELLSANKDLAEKVGVLEREQIKQGKVIVEVYQTLKQLEKDPPNTSNPIEFEVKN